METVNQPESFFYVKSGFKIVKRYWYLFVISVILCAGCAFFINWYLQPVYEVNSVILIDKSKPNQPNASEEFMKSFSIFSPVSDIQQEMLKMKSSDLIHKALTKINAEVSYYVSNGIKTRELYNEFPFRVSVDKSHIQPLGVKIQVIPITGDRFRIFTEASDEAVTLCNYDEKNEKCEVASSFFIDQEFTAGDTIKSDLFSFRIQVDKNKIPGFKPDTKFFFVFNDLGSLTYVYQKAVNIDQVAKEIQAASISIKIENPQQGIDFINALTEAYLQRNIEKKNFIAENTIKYLDEQLGVIEDSLQLTESNLQSFRSSNRVMDISAKADQSFKEARDLENQKAELQSRIKYYSYINANLEKDQNGSSLLVPSSMGVNDNVLTSIIEEYIRLNNERNNLILNKQSQSPYFNNLTIKINNQKNTLSENVKHLINTNSLLLASVEERLRKENAQISSLPNTERKLVGIERKYRLNDDNYNYMLKKKAEAQVAKASSLPDNDIMEPAKLTQPGPVSPNKKINIGIGIVLGLFLPFIGFGVRSLMDNTIADEQVMQSLTHLPSIGKIHHKKNRKTGSVLIEAPKSAISESIRSVRTNLEYFLQGKRNQVILLTSTMAGEGKSFSSLNLATSLALLNRRTLLIDFDIRKPNLYQSLNVENKLGISSVLAGQATIDEVLVSTGIPYFDFITAGPVPSNPAELISSEKIESLIGDLKQKYDYVIIDTPPIGLVTEGYLLMKYADLKIFVVREKVTEKKPLLSILKDIENKKVENVYWLLNDVDTQDTVYGQNNEYFTQN